MISNIRKILNKVCYNVYWFLLDQFVSLREAALAAAKESDGKNTCTAQKQCVYAQGVRISDLWSEL